MVCGRLRFVRHILLDTFAKKVNSQRMTTTANNDNASAATTAQLIDGAGRIMDGPTELDRHYYYRPCQFDNGKTLKCAGFGAEKKEHREFYVPHFDSANGCENTHLLPGVMILRGYHGDKVSLDYAYSNQLSPE